MGGFKGLNIGDRIELCEHDIPSALTCKLSGKVVGFGYKGSDSIFVLVELDEGGYISNNKTHTYVSILPVLWDNIPEDQR